MDKPDLFEKYRSFCIGIAYFQFYLTADADVGATLIIGDYIVFRFFPYNSKSCGAIFKKLTFLKNLDQNASKTPPLPPPLRGLLERVQISTLRMEKQAFWTLSSSPLNGGGEGGGFDVF